jgi:hypothetical protein
MIDYMHQSCSIDLAYESAFLQHGGIGTFSWETPFLVFA